MWRVASPRCRRAATERHGGCRRKRSGRTAFVVFVLVVAGLVALSFMPLDAPSFEKAATARLGVPVKIGSARLSFEPLPALRFDRVAIGPRGEVKIASVKANGGL